MLHKFLLSVKKMQRYRSVYNKITTDTSSFPILLITPLPKNNLKRHLQYSSGHFLINCLHTIPSFGCVCKNKWDHIIGYILHLLYCLALYLGKHYVSIQRNLLSSF